MHRDHFILLRLELDYWRSHMTSNSLIGLKAIANTSHIEEVPAEKLLGHTFVGKKIIQRLEFTTPDGKKMHVRLVNRADAPELFHFYYTTLSENSRQLFASRPIFHPRHESAQHMHERLVRMSVDEYPQGNDLAEINEGKRADIFNPKFPVIKEVRAVVDGIEKIVQPQVLFDPSLNYVIEDSNKKIVGFFQLKYLASTPNFGVAVSDSMHGKGLGRLGLRLAIDAARRLGLPRIILTHDPRNTAANLYASEGFKPIGTTKVLEGTKDEHEEIKMELKL